VQGCSLGLETWFITSRSRFGRGLNVSRFNVSRELLNIAGDVSAGHFFLLKLNQFSRWRTISTLQNYSSSGQLWINYTVSTVSQASQELSNLNSFMTHTTATLIPMAMFNKLYGLRPLTQRLLVHRRAQRGERRLFSLASLIMRPITRNRLSKERPSRRVFLM